MKKTMLCILVIALSISLLAGCGATGFSGRYTAEDGDAYDFNGHGAVTVTLGGETIQAYTYAVSGADVFVYEPDYDHVAGGETDNILTAVGDTLTDKDGKVFTKAK